MSRVREISSDGLVIVFTETDGLGNEVTRSLGPITGYSPPTNPSGQTPPEETFGQDPIVPETNTVGKQTDTGAGSPTSPGVYDVEVKEQAAFGDGDPDLYSLSVSPGIISGWTASEAAREEDGKFASVAATSGAYSTALSLSNFDFSQVPEDATITGIRVRVKRRRLT